MDRAKALTDELKRVIRCAARKSGDLQDTIPVLESFALVQAAGELDSEQRVHVVLGELIPTYAARLPENPEGMAIRELLKWRDEDERVQSLTTRYAAAAEVLGVAPADFGRRREPKLLRECADRFIVIEHKERRSRDLGPSDDPPAPLAPADPTAGIVNVHRRLDLYRLAEELPEALKILILNTWIPALDIFAGELAQALANGAEVKILMLHPNSSAARLRTAGLNTSSRFRTHEVEHGVGSCLSKLGNIAAELDEESRSRLKVRLYDSLPSIAVYSVDGRAMVSVFTHGKLAVSSPQIEVHDSTSWLGQSIAEEIRTLWGIAAPVTDLTNWQEEINAKKLSAGARR